MTAHATPPDLLTEDEAAQRLRVCPRTLRNARRDGRLSYVLIGRAVRYTQSDLDAFIESSRQDGPICKPEPVRRSAAKGTAKIIPFTAR